MADSHDSQRVIVVAGDVTMDWNLARKQRMETGLAGWNADGATQVYLQSGGTGLLAELIAAVAGKLGREQYDVRQMAVAADTVRPGDERYHHSYALWSPVKKAENSKDEVWRVEEFLGLDARKTVSINENKVVNDTADAHTVVLDDAGLGFRQQSELWPKAVTTEGKAPWIILKIARPVVQGGLWEQLYKQHAERLIVVMTINDLRLTEVQISRELSWERTAQDITRELIHNPQINALSRCAHVVISFHTAGAFLFSRGRASEKLPARFQLIFDPKEIEGTWSEKYPGGMVGYTSCLTASLARQVMLGPEQPNIERGIQAGLAAMRELHLVGYGKKDEALTFPTATIVEEIASDKSLFAVTDVRGDRWTILQERHTGGLEGLAEKIVLEGAEAALQDVPLGQFGKLLTVDRQEIENFRSIRNLIGEYHRRGQTKPLLSIAVFGAPGSGKSFGIAEVAQALLPGKLAKLTFNLSQFRDPSQLLDALHEVRDVGLSGKLPLVFWDEFDTKLNGQELGWLAHFLSPMQDAAFQQGQINHNIGCAIFVFAGGTKESMEAFDRGDEEFRQAKGPDFVSRLKGYVNILGPNPQGGEPLYDPYSIIRRAILLRSLLARDVPQLFDEGKKLRIDTGVLRALLQIGKYKHGVRSMEAIIGMSLLKGRSKYERSCLPATTQLELHVDAQAFQNLVQRMELKVDEKKLELMAEEVHKVFCENLSAEEKKTHSSLKDYADLSPDEQEQNRGNVRDIPQKLAQCGLLVIPVRGDEQAVGFSPYIETLAEQEHNRWMKAKLAAGWRWAAATDKPNKLHKDLLLWNEKPDQESESIFTPAELDALGDDALLEAEKEKDRVLVRGIPRILEKGGFTIIRNAEAGE